MVSVPFPSSTSPGQNAQESGGRLINCSAEPLSETAGSKVVLRRSPGLTSFGTSGGTGYRGGILVGATFYAGWGSRIERYTSAGGAGTLVGTLNGTAKSFWARNNKTTPDLVVVSPGDGAFTVTPSAVTAYADADLPAPNSVCFHGGYFFFSIGDGRMFASGLNAVTQNALDVATAESKPDTLHRIVPLASQILACGSDSMEIWGPPINASAFPYSYVTTVTAEDGGAIGLASPYGIAGYENGFRGSVGFVGNDNGFHLLRGYAASKVSPPDLDRLIEAVTDKSTIEVTAYVVQGHACLAVSCPAWTWVFDQNTLKWHERESYGIARGRATQAHNAFGKWIVGDTTSGALYWIDPMARKEGTNPLRMRVETGMAPYPPHTPVAQLNVYVTTGVGIATGDDPSQTDPTIEISCTVDGGTRWSTPLLRKLGRQSIAEQVVKVNRPARTKERGIRWRFDISDAVHVGLMAAEMRQNL